MFFQIALSVILVIAPFTSTAITLTLRQPSTQSEETHEEGEQEKQEKQEKVEGRAGEGPPDDAPVRTQNIAMHALPPAFEIWTPSAAPPQVHPAKYSERRLR